MLNVFNYVCGVGIMDCFVIQFGVMCYFFNILVVYVFFVFNEYYYKFGVNYYNCYFNGIVIISNSDLSE